MQSNPKFMKPKLLKGIQSIFIIILENHKMKLLTDSKNTSVRNYPPPPNLSAKETDLIK